MRVAIIKAAGISSRFNRGIGQDEKKLKVIYSENGRRNTLLFHLLEKCCYADKIIVVGGYRFADLQEYILSELDGAMREKISLIYNDKYSELASGYTFYLGLQEAFRCFADDVVFMEGDLDVDAASFQKVIGAEASVLTYNREPIYTNSAVVLYKNGNGQFKYAYNSRHGLLKIPEAFSCILQSGQIWKFRDMDALQAACRSFCDTDMGEIDLKIVQKYVNRIPSGEIELIELRRWANCNTREDYRAILRFWKEGQEEAAL